MDQLTLEKNKVIFIDCQKKGSHYRAVKFLHERYGATIWKGQSPEQKIPESKVFDMYDQFRLIYAYPESKYYTDGKYKHHIYGAQSVAEMKARFHDKNLEVEEHEVPVSWSPTKTEVQEPQNDIAKELLGHRKILDSNLIEFLDKGWRIVAGPIIESTLVSGDKTLYNHYFIIKQGE